MTPGDRVTGPVTQAGRPPQGNEPRDTGTVVQAYEGMTTRTLYAIVEWDGHGVHCSRQADLEAAKQ